VNYQSPINIQGARALFSDNVIAKWPSMDEDQWYRWMLIDAAAASVHAQGATLTVPTTRTIGGYSLDASTEYIYPSVYLMDDYAGGAIKFYTFFETGEDNLPGHQSDEVRLVANFFFKSLHRDLDGTLYPICNTYGPVNHDVKIKQAKTFETYVSLHEFYGNKDAKPRSNMIVKARIHLDTTHSEVSEVIVNYFLVGYKTNTVHNRNIPLDWQSNLR